MSARFNQLGVVGGTDIPETDFNPMTVWDRVAGDSMDMYEALRAVHPCAIHSNQGPRGFWMGTNAKIIREVFQKPDLFSNSSPGWHETEPAFNLIPEYLDPPVHTSWRQLLSPFFAPARVNTMEDGLRAQARELVERLAPLGSCDYIKDFSQIFPTTVFLDIFGVPTSELQQFMRWEAEILHSHTDESGYQTAARAMGEVRDMFSELIVHKRQRPGDDILSYAVTWEIDGAPIPDEDLLAFALLMFMAGLDTITNELAYATWHFANHPHDLKRIVEDPAVIPMAIEEVLRFYPIVTPGRLVTRSVEFHGCPMKAGDVINLPLVMATRDPDEFADAHLFIVDRDVNNHIGFGAGPHRCLGSHLARREMKVAIEEWHKVIPSYRMQDGSRAPEYIGIQIGMKSLPIEWDV